MMTSRPLDPGPVADVEAHETDGRWTLVFRRRLRHPRPRVWAALTERDQLTAWAPFTADRDLTQPGAATLTMIDGSTTVDLPAHVERAEPPRLLEYTWGDDLLRWELADDGDGTMLTLHHTVGDAEQLARAAAGWHLCLAVAERLLDGDPVGPIVGAEARNHGWDALHDTYAERLGVPGGGWPAGIFEDR
jgi:uncharacterized protein YndB with AHSA1/START domain